MKLKIVWHKKWKQHISWLISFRHNFLFTINCIFWVNNLLLALLPIGPAHHSISSNFCSCIFSWWISARTELFQNGVLLVRILTIVDRISISFFKPGDLRFRPDSGQMEEDLDALLLSSQIMFVHEDLLQAQDQSKEDLILLRLITHFFF